MEPSTSAHPPCEDFMEFVGCLGCFIFSLCHFCHFSLCPLKCLKMLRLSSFLHTSRLHTPVLPPGWPELGLRDCCNVGIFLSYISVSFHSFYVSFVSLKNTKSCSHETWRGIQATTPYCSCSRAATWLKGAGSAGF